MISTHSVSNLQECTIVGDECAAVASFNAEYDRSVLLGVMPRGGNRPHPADLPYTSAVCLRGLGRHSARSFAAKHPKVPRFVVSLVPQPYELDGVSLLPVRAALAEIRGWLGQP